MDFNKYQETLSPFAIYSHVDYSAVNLSAEANEILDKLGKFGRTHRISIAEAMGRACKPKTPEDLKLRTSLVKELGDVLAMVSFMCDDLGVSMGTVAFHNLAKLSDRAKRNVLDGSGDER